MDITSLASFYKEIAAAAPDDLTKETGHFDVFNLAELTAGGKVTMPYNRRTYYKISLIEGRNKAEYADKEVDIESGALLFATPKIPYNWIPLDASQSGYFCIFTHEFLVTSKSGVVLDDLPIFRPGGYPIFQLNEQAKTELTAIFKKMYQERSSDYVYKYDLLRNYVLELIHYGQKLQPAETLLASHTAATRVSALFMELLERQFPIVAPGQKLKLRKAKDYADQLAVHVNHLNKVLKESTGKTTTDVIGSRILQEAKILLRQTNWNISEISYSLGFEQVAHFSNFFRKQTALAPAAFRK
jgi:AraC family transcriptional activator of pobA